MDALDLFTDEIDNVAKTAAIESSPKFIRGADLKPEEASGSHKRLEDDESVELEQIKSKDSTIENDVHSASKYESEVEKENFDGDSTLESKNVYADSESPDQTLSGEKTLDAGSKKQQETKNITASSTRDNAFISLDTMSPSVRFYSHVRLASALDHKAMMLSKGPDNYPWSQHFRQAVLVQHKAPVPPYFHQLPSGERPDTLIVNSIPAIWFLDEDDEDANESLDDRLYNFTLRGSTILQAAFLRFGEVKAVDLLFEMVNRDQEDSLAFDVFVQFKSFDSFCKAFYAMNNAVLYNDQKPNMQILCSSKFDTSGYFCRQKRRLRAARRDLAKQRREQSEKKAKMQLLKAQRSIKEHHGRLMKEFKKCQDRIEALNENAKEIRNLVVVESGISKATALAEAAEKLSVSADNLSKFEAALKRCKSQLQKMEKIVSTEVAVSKLKVPTIHDVLEDNRAYRFLELVREKLDEDPKFFDGRTVFVPPDHAFLDEFVETWEEECWGTHAINGPYFMQDLYILGNRGPGMMLCADMSFTLFCGLNEAGEYIVWVSRRNQPRRIIRIISPDIRVQGGSVVHFIDKIIYPE